MPIADQSTTRGGISETAEKFTARDITGRVVVIEKQGSAPTENAIGGLEWSGPDTAYRVQGGSAVERIDESTFRIVATGQIVRREEGQHGITHHSQHQTPARP